MFKILSQLPKDAFGVVTDAFAGKPVDLWELERAVQDIVEFAVKEVEQRVDMKGSSFDVSVSLMPPSDEDE